MPVSGRKPKAPGESLSKSRAIHDFTEVENVPFTDAKRRLPKYRPSGGKWSDAAIKRWRTWRQMPHCALWSESEWDFCIDTVEVAALFYETGQSKYVSELRVRERAMGTTSDALRDLRIRYVEPKTNAPVVALVPSANDFADL